MALGKYEQELHTAADSAVDWSIPGLSALLASLDHLEKAMKTIAGDPGVKGHSGDAAEQHFAALNAKFQDLHQNVSEIQAAIEDANRIRKQHAEAALAALPSTAIDPWVVVAVGVGAPFVFPGIVGPLAAVTAINTIQQHLDAQRETAAQTHVVALGETMSSVPIPAVGTISANKSDSATTTTATTTGGGSGARPTVNAATLSSGPGSPKSHTDDPTSPGLVIDGPTSGGPLTTGTLPGGTFGGAPGGGTAGGLAGASTGGLAAGAAGLAALGAASRFGGAGMGGSTASVPLGSGGLLGSSGKAASAAAAAAESEAATGTKPGSSMMGSPGGSGGGNKQKRAGLGGFIAPKLEDDEERGPRSTAALAGGRDSAPQE